MSHRDAGITRLPAASSKRMLVHTVFDPTWFCDGRLTVPCRSDMIGELPVDIVVSMYLIKTKASKMYHHYDSTFFRLI
jgi:hypothetical protein